MTLGTILSHSISGLPRARCLLRGLSKLKCPQVHKKGEVALLKFKRRGVVLFRQLSYALGQALESFRGDFTYLGQPWGV